MRVLCLGVLGIVLSAGAIERNVLAAGCEAESWSPEVYWLYGDAETVISKVEKLNADLPNRRLYMLAIEDASGSSEFTIFEKGKDGKVAVSYWRGKDLRDVDGQIMKAILANKGVACVGEQSKAIVTRTLTKLESKGEIPAPVSEKSAFSHAIRGHQGFLRATVYLMC